MSFFALATLLTVTSLENAVINQTNALDDWRSGLGFLSAQSESEAATATSAGVDEFVLTAVNAQALDELDEEYQLDRITEVDAIITNPDLFRDDDDRIADITPDVTATFSSLSPSEASATVSPALETPNEADTPSATAKEADPKADTSVYSPGDPLREQQWALDQIGVTDATPRGSGKQKIAVIDSGVWDQHPDLAGRVTAQYHVVDGKALRVGLHSPEFCFREWPDPQQRAVGVPRGCGAADRRHRAHLHQFPEPCGGAAREAAGLCGQCPCPGRCGTRVGDRPTHPVGPGGDPDLWFGQDLDPRRHDGGGHRGGSSELRGDDVGSFRPRDPG